MTLLELHDFAIKKNILVKFLALNSKGLAMRVLSQEVIAIDKSIVSEQDEKLILAEELGHCLNQAWYNTYGDKEFTVFRAKVAEHRASNWKVKNLVELDKLIKALRNGISMPQELSEYFNVPVEIILAALELYQDDPKILALKSYDEEDF